MADSLGRTTHYRVKKDLKSGWMLVREQAPNLDPANRQLAINELHHEIHIATALRAAEAYKKGPIIEIYEPLDTNENGSYLLLQYVSDCWLSNALVDGHLSERNALVVARDLTRAVDTHTQVGIVHLNIQPTTILLEFADEQRQVVKGAWLDCYAYACFVDQRDGSIDPRKLVRDYNAPELRDGADPSPEHDLYSIGVVLFTMLGGKLNDRFSNAPLDTSLLKVSSKTEEIIRKALNSIPGQRYQKPTDLLTDLNAALEALQPTSNEYGERSSPPPGDNTRLIIILSFLALLLIGCFGSLFLQRTPWFASAITIPTKTVSTQSASTTPAIAEESFQLPLTPIFLSPSPQTSTSIPPTATAVPPTATSIPPTATAVPPTATSIPPTATAVPPTATSTPRPVVPVPTPTEIPRLRFQKLNEDDDPRCISVQIRDIKTEGWSFKIVGRPFIGIFDRAGNARICGLAPREEVIFDVLNRSGQIIRGGQGIPSRGSAIMRAIWR
jgi:serine/threonine protein kinase